MTLIPTTQLPVRPALSSPPKDQSRRGAKLIELDEAEEHVKFLKLNSRYQVVDYRLKFEIRIRQLADEIRNKLKI